MGGARLLMADRIVTGVRADQAAAELRRRARDKWRMANSTRNAALAARLRVEAQELDTRATLAESRAQRVLM